MHPQAPLPHEEWLQWKKLGGVLIFAAVQGGHAMAGCREDASWSGGRKSKSATKVCMSVLQQALLRASRAPKQQGVAASKRVFVSSRRKLKINGIRRVDTQGETLLDHSARLSRRVVSRRTG